MRPARTVAVFALAAATLAAGAFGPPQLNVTEVRGTPPVAGAVLLLEGHHHTDEPEADVSGRAITVRNGERVTRDLALARYGAAGRYAVTRQWDAGTPWVLLFSIRQGDHDDFNQADVLVQVDATGRILAIEKLMQDNPRGGRFQRKATDAELRAALAAVGLRGR